MRLWIGVYLPHLALEVFRPTWLAESVSCAPQADTHLPGMLVFDNDRVFRASANARRAGVRPGMRRGSALILHPDADCRARDSAREHAVQQGVAVALMQYTPQVALLPENLILMDVSASLRLFGGIRALRRAIRSTVQTCGVSARFGIAPTGAGAGILARANAGYALRLTARTVSAASSDAARTCGQRRSLSTLIDRLPLTLLPSAHAFTDWFTGLGCHTLGELRRLPRAGLKRRCGETLLDELDQALGHSAGRFVWLTLPDQFDARQELPDHIQQADAVLACAAGLLAQLSGWLSARQLAVTHIIVQLDHERGRDAVAPTELSIALSEASAQDSHLRRLLSERLAAPHVINASAVVAVRLHAPAPVAATLRSVHLFPEPGGSAGDHARLMELLCARLGTDNVQCADPRPDHRPEYANHWVASPDSGNQALADNSLKKPASRISKSKPLDSAAQIQAQHTPRPVWLLAQPVALLTRHHRPFYGSPLRLISPAERIEAGWWDLQRDGADSAMRDYFVAEAEDHSCYWIFRERLPDGDDDAVRWYLHGLFG